MSVSGRRLAHDRKLQKPAMAATSTSTSTSTTVATAGTFAEPISVLHRYLGSATQ